MKVSTIAAIIAAFTGAAAAVVTYVACKGLSESPDAAPQGAVAFKVASKQLSAEACPAPCYLNEPGPDIWKGTEQQQFFHLSEGSEVFPYGALLAIHSPDDTPFFDPSKPTFGLLAEPKDTTCDPNQQWCNSYGVPVGMTVAKTRDTQLLDMKMFGFNCAACHVGELQAGGNTYRVLGGPNMFDAIGFVVGLKNAVGYTEGSVEQIVLFLARWAVNGDNAIGNTDIQFLALVQAAPAEIQTRSPVGLALAHALQQTFDEVSKESFPPRGPGLHLGPAPASLADRQTVMPRPIPPGSRPGLPPGKSSFSLPPTRPTTSSVASLAKTELAPLDKVFSNALSSTPLDDARPFEKLLNAAPPDDRVHILESYVIDFEEALALLKERFSALTNLGGGGKGGQGGVQMTPPGPGRVDAFMTARNILFPDSSAPATSPVDIPRIWGLRGFPWYHWDGNTNSLIERNVGQAVVIGAVIDPKNYQSTLLIENIQTLEDLAGQIPTPKWQFDIDADAGARGQVLFEQQCRGCHGSGNDAGTALDKVNTDGLRIHNFSLPMADGGQFDQALKAELDAVMTAAYDYADAAADAREDPGNTTIRAPQQYANRSLDGVWATAPYLHNGSVASLADLLEPASHRTSPVTVGGRVYDTDRVGYTAAPGAFSRDGGAQGDSMGGHEYGTDAGAEDKKALLEYLKSL
jgi:hypothetical protein